MPNMIPEWPTGARSTAEAKVYEALKRTLPEDYTVIQNATWIEERNDAPQECEADFVIAHPARGILVLEVKGGAVNYDYRSGVWTQSAGRAPRTIKDPFVQAQGNAHSLLRLLKASSSFPQEWRGLGYAVAFPDGQVASSLPAHAPSQLVFDATELLDRERLRRRLDGALNFWRAPGSPEVGSRVIRIMLNKIARDFRVRTLKLAIDETEAEYLTLSKEQYEVLDAMEENPRVGISGCAGSGKTMLAMEKARRLAEAGHKTLLTCYNRPLANHLSALAAPLGNLMVRTFHQLCASMADAAHIDVTRGLTKEHDYYDRVLPEALWDAIDNVGPQFSAIIVDEGQDFHNSWWAPLQRALDQPEAGIFYVFYDDNQVLYDRPRDLPSGMARYQLRENWRNTRHIHDLVNLFYEGPPVRVRGPDGVEVETMSVSSRDEIREELRKLLHRLCREEGLTCQDLVVLTPLAEDNSGLLGHVGPFNLTREPVESNDVKLSSIFHYKGLECKVAILAGLRTRDVDSRELMYVGCSRPRSHLAVIGYDSIYKSR